MSYDFALLKVCSHLIVDESVRLDLDTSQYVTLPRRLSNERVKVYIDSLEVPKSGLFSTPYISTIASEPFKIVQGKSDMIQLKIQNGPIQTITLNPGNLVSADSLAFDLSRKIPALSITSEDGHVKMSAPSAYKGQFFTLVDPRWTDKAGISKNTSRIMSTYSALGLTAGRCATGVEIYPGWELTVNAFDPLESTVLRFITPILNNNPTVTITYSTLAQFCGRCQGSRLEYDYTVEKSTYETVRNSDLLVQEADKFMFTEIGSHWKWPWLGSRILNRIGSKANPSGSSSAGLVSIDISQAFATYQNIKSQQANNYGFQNVTDAEFPANISDLSVNNVAEDPTIVLANFTIANRSTDLVPLTRIVNSPDPFQVTADPAGVIQQAGSNFILRG